MGSGVSAAMAKLFLILLTGFVCQKCKVFPEGAHAALTRLILYVATPCTIVNSVLSNSGLLSLRDMPGILAASVGCYGMMLAVSWLLVRLIRVPAGSRGAYLCMMTFSNGGFIGYPVISSVYGPEAVFYGAVFGMPVFLIIYSFGAYVLMRDARATCGTTGDKVPKAGWKVLLNPCLVASYLAIFLVLTGLRPGPILSDTVGMISGMTTPGALLAIGISIAKMPIKKLMSVPRVYFASLVRLVVLPLLSWPLICLAVQVPEIRGACLISVSMPVAAAVPVMAKEYGSDEELCSSGVFLSTMMGLVTIPVLLSLLTA